MPGDFSTAMLIPLLISGCGISLTAIVVLIYHLLIVHYCLGRQNQLAADTNLGFSSSAADPVPPTKLGIDDSSLSLIPTAPYSGRMFDDVLKGDQSECAICLTDLEDGDPVRVLPNCRHVFHLDCIDHWLSSHVNCPFCRSQIFPFLFPEWIVEFRGGNEAEGRRIGRLVPVCRRKDNPPVAGVGFDKKSTAPMENPNNPKSTVAGETSHVEINVAENEIPPASSSSSSSTSFSSCFSPDCSVNVPSEASISN